MPLEQTVHVKQHKTNKTSHLYYSTGGARLANVTVAVDQATKDTHTIHTVMQLAIHTFYIQQGIKKLIMTS